MVVVVQQSSAECIAIFTVSMYGLTLPHKTSTDQQWNGYQNHARIQDRRSMCLQHTEHFDLILLHLGITNTSAYL